MNFNNSFSFKNFTFWRVLVSILFEVANSFRIAQELKCIFLPEGSDKDRNIRARSGAGVRLETTLDERDKCFVIYVFYILLRRRSQACAI